MKYQHLRILCPLASPLSWTCTTHWALTGAQSAKVLRKSVVLKGSDYSPLCAAAPLCNYMYYRDIYSKNEGTKISTKQGRKREVARWQDAHKRIFFSHTCSAIKRMLQDGSTPVCLPCQLAMQEKKNYEVPTTSQPVACCVSAADIARWSQASHKTQRTW